MSGIGTRLLKVEIDGVEYSGQVSKATITSGEADRDFITFAEAAQGGGREYKLEFTAVQDAATGSLWSEIFDNAGTTVPYSLQPYGNAVPSATEPHFEGFAVISEPDGDFLGGEADASATAKMTVEVSWALTAKPARVTV